MAEIDAQHAAVHADRVFAERVLAGPRPGSSGKQAMIARREPVTAPRLGEGDREHVRVRIERLRPVARPNGKDVRRIAHAQQEHEIGRAVAVQVAALAGDDRPARRNEARGIGGGARQGRIADRRNDQRLGRGLARAQGAEKGRL